MPTPRKKLIEVALPLDAINREAAREKSIRHGHPSTLHLWWARRPLAAARAVIFAQMVDDPSSVPEEFPTEEAQEKERQRLFRLIEELVKWENTTNERVLEEARAEIRKSWARWCKESGEDPNKLPPFHDPFAGGGSLPLEAQRLGLEAHASDLNPVAVVINKAMIEIPPRFAGQPPVNPEARAKWGSQTGWKGAAGLAEDVRYYGTWMREEAFRRIGHLYPQVTLPNGKKATVVAWLWARTVPSPDPGFAECQVPLVSSFFLSRKTGKNVWVEPVIEGKGYHFEVRYGGKPHITESVNRRGGVCILSRSPMTFNYIREQGRTGKMKRRLMAVVAEGDNERVFLSPSEQMENIASEVSGYWSPDYSLPRNPRDFKTPNYGLTTFASLFTTRQLLALTTFSDLVAEARKKAFEDASAAGLAADSASLGEDSVSAGAYADAISTYLAISVDRLADRSSTICGWDVGYSKIRNTFGRQAVPMTWDYAEGNPFSSSTGNWEAMVEWVCKVICTVPAKGHGTVIQENAMLHSVDAPSIYSTDPPYYDNIGYAELSDFFYVWMRRCLAPVFPSLFSTLLVPKNEELVATPYRHGGREKAEHFFLSGMSKIMNILAATSHSAFPVTVYYAFKQSETNEEGDISTGWETFLEAVIRSGFTITGTWPIRTELANKLIGVNANVLASSIVLVCRPRVTGASMVSRRDFVTALRRELPSALHFLQRGNVAPVDLAQAGIGPGMSIFTRFARVLESDGTSMRVRTALALINQVLDEVLAEQEGQFDQDTGWAVTWFDQYGFAEGPYDEAEKLCKAKNTAINGLQEAGVLTAKAGKVRLLQIDELSDTWDPVMDKRLTVWEAVHHLIKSLNNGESTAATLVNRLGGQAEAARDLAYRLYNICERRKRAQEAQAYNALVQSWPEIIRLARELKGAPPSLGGLFKGDE